MPIMSPTDSMFLLYESRAVPTHVGGLQLFDLPAAAPPDFVAEGFEHLLETGEMHPLFAKRPRRSAATLGQWAWEKDDHLDLAYHVRHSALPEPGRVRELLALGSRLHGTLLDRQRPLWEFHLIEGLAGGRFATYTKIHHSLVDGVSALRLLARSLTEDPDEIIQPPWTARPHSRPTSPDEATEPGLVGSTLGAARDLATLPPALIRTARRSVRDHLAAFPFQAPPSILNGRITGARRFAAESWSFERVRALGKASGSTINDVVLAMSGGALRRYLADLGALPDDPLVAMVPVSLRGDDSAEGNAVGAVLANLATDAEDPAERLERVRTSMAYGKASLAGLSQIQALAISASTVGPMALMPLLGGGAGMRPPFNLIISNIPGPRVPLFWNGARLSGIYPMSIPCHGQALNITTTSYVDQLEFGLTGCRRSVPHLQRLLDHLEAELTALEITAGVV